MSSTSPKFALDREACSRCNLCLDDCVTHAISSDQDGLPTMHTEQEASCVLCQHCLAICPEGAISIQGLRPENSQSVDFEAQPTFAQMDRLVRSRRSVRKYHPENVADELIEQLLAAIAHAPTGVNARQLTFSVIKDRSSLAALRTSVLDAIAAAAASGTLGKYAVFLAQAVHRWKEEGVDLIFRGAPHLLIVSSPPTTPCPQQDVSLTLAYFELLAQSAGLGTVWCGYLKVVLETVPSLKPLLGLPEDHAYYAMLFGAPAVKYARTVQREGSARIHRIRL
jgi:nitroreductase/NAD-dependent dihydropyrimidine dehydrogenase PreA subunit